MRGRRPRPWRSSGGGVLHETATQFMGLIVVAMVVQFALTGVRSFFVEHP
jgi:small neutral amino acid transporter SnatA (MarC family)